MHSAYQRKTWDLKERRKGTWKSKGSWVPVGWLHTCSLRWGWQMMSWANVSSNEWAPSPLSQRPWRNPLGIAGGPRHRAGPPHRPYRGVACGKGEVLNLLTPGNKDNRQTFSLLSSPGFPRYQRAMLLWLVRTSAFGTKPFLYLGELSQFTQVSQRENPDIMVPEQFKRSKFSHLRRKFFYQQRKFISQKQISLPFAHIIQHIN